MSFAKGTTVSVDKTRVEVERLLRTSGASMVVVQTTSTVARIGFEAHGRRLLFTLTLPDRTDRKFTHVDKWKARAVGVADKLHDAECRRLWRALLLVVKAKIESVASGIETFDQAFLANIVVPTAEGSTTVGVQIAGYLHASYARGVAMPKLLGT
jgi:hypothetical protein